MKTLYIIDGYAQFFRAYHAIRSPMSSPVTKEPTNMTFGVSGMLLKLFRGDAPGMAALGGRPDYVFVAMDVSGDRGTFRSELYPEYKATRQPPPDDLKPQVERCLAMLGEIGVPIIGSPGFEADDVIATLAERLRREHPDLRVRIISKDKDLKQILQPCDAEGCGVEMYDIHTDEVINAETLKEETGLEPSQVVDMLALMGDTVDNVPGVEGVGPKTAAQLIAQYGSLEALLARADEIKGKRGEKLREAAPKLALSRELVMLRRDVPVELDLEAARTERFALERLGPIFRELGFNRYQDDLKALLARGEEEPAPAAPAAGAGRGRDVGASGRFSGGLFDAASPAEPVRPAEGEYRAVTTARELRELVATLEAAPVISLDTETTSLGAMRAKLAGISLSVEPGTGFYIPVRSPAPEKHMDEATVLTGLRAVLEDPEKPKSGHNLKYDLLVLRRAGVEVRGLTAGGDGGAEGGCDSMVASYLIDPSRSSHSLDALSLALLRRSNIKITDLIGTGKDQRSFDQVPIEDATQYAAEDADVALRLREMMLPQLRAMGLDRLWAEVEMPLVEVLAELEYNGVLVDPAELERQRARLQERIDALSKEIGEASMASIGRTFNPDSPKQLGSVLFNKADAAEPGLGLRPVRKTKTGNSTDNEVLEKLAGDPDLPTPIPGLILEYRRLTKLVGTYLVNLKETINPETGRIHASFNQTVAATGRLSSSDPNLQNIPIRTEVGREIRKAFIAPPGRVLITADYSQIELRLLAHLSQDPALSEAFHQDLDVHTAVAAQVFGVPVDQVTGEQRSKAKMVNFGIVYGVTAFGLARRLRIGEREAAEIITSYKKRFAGIATFLEECIAQARRFGYVETMLKRRRPIDGIDDRSPQRRALAERLAINSVVQGSAADMIKIAMIDLHRRLSPFAAHHREGRPPEFEGVKMLLQIHDELVFEAPRETADAACALVVERMERAMELSVPLRADAGIGTNWFDS